MQEKYQGTRQKVCGNIAMNETKRYARRIARTYIGKEACKRSCKEAGKTYANKVARKYQISTQEM